MDRQDFTNVRHSISTCVKIELNNTGSKFNFGWTTDLIVQLLGYDSFHVGSATSFINRNETPKLRRFILNSKFWQICTNFQHDTDHLRLPWINLSHLIWSFAVTCWIQWYSPPAGFAEKLSAPGRCFPCGSNARLKARHYAVPSPQWKCEKCDCGHYNVIHMLGILGCMWSRGRFV